MLPFGDVERLGALLGGMVEDVVEVADVVIEENEDDDD